MNTPSPSGPELEVRRLMAIAPVMTLMLTGTGEGGDLGHAEAHSYRAHAYVALCNLDAVTDLKQAAYALKRSAR